MRRCGRRPARKYPLITAGEIIAKEGNAYEAKKNDTEVREHTLRLTTLSVMLDVM